jgi:electron transfer flavoprotein beta subunit
MRIIVPIKQILDPQGISVRRDKERIFINREEYILDPASKAAIEAALRLTAEAACPVRRHGVLRKEASGAEVIALCMGRPQADDALREALAMGCDSAYLLSDKAFEDADISVTARILAAAIAKLGGADLIVAGRQSGDTGAGQMGPRLAEALDYAQVTDVYAMAVPDGALQATRGWGDGFAAVEARLPIVASVAPQAFPPRYPHGARIMSAYREWTVTVWTASDLDLDEAALSPSLSFRGESFPPPLEVGEVFRGDPADVAQDVVTALKMRKLIA